MMNNKAYIYSTAKSDLRVTWLIAVVLSLFSYPIITVGFQKADGIGLTIILAFFPLLAILFLYFAIRDTSSCFKYGRIPLLLDPPIGSIGGDIGGTIYLNNAYDSDAKFKVVLTNIYSYTTRKYEHLNSSRTRIFYEILWEDEGYAEVKNIADKTQLKFRFEIPEGLKESHTFANKSYYWEVVVTQGSNTDTFKRSFTIPVKASNKTSSHLHMKTTDTVPQGIQKTTASTILSIQETTSGYQIHYPIFFHILGIQGFGIFGGIFLSVGLGVSLLSFSGFGIFIGSVLSLFGAAIISYGLYDFLIETYICYDNIQISSKRYFLGIPMKKLSLTLDDKINILYIDIFRKPVKEGTVNKFAFLAVKRENRQIILAKYIGSIKSQKILKKYFEERLVKHMNKCDK